MPGRYPQGDFPPSPPGRPARFARRATGGSFRAALLPRAWCRDGNSPAPGNGRPRRDGSRIIRGRVGFSGALARKGTADHGGDAAHTRLVVTRGARGRSFQHPFHSGPTLSIVGEQFRLRPVRLATVPQVRGRPDSRDPKLNSHPPTELRTRRDRHQQARGKGGPGARPARSREHGQHLRIPLDPRGRDRDEHRRLRPAGKSPREDMRGRRKAGLPVRGSNFSPTGTHRAVHASTGCAGAEGARAAVRGQRAALVAAALPCSKSLVAQSPPAEPGKGLTSRSSLSHRPSPHAGGRFQPPAPAWISGCLPPYPSGPPWIGRLPPRGGGPPRIGQSCPGRRLAGTVPASAHPNPTPAPYPALVLNATEPGYSL